MRRFMLACFCQLPRRKPLIAAFRYDSWAKRSILRVIDHCRPSEL